MTRRLCLAPTAPGGVAEPADEVGIPATELRRRRRDGLTPEVGDPRAGPRSGPRRLEVLGPPIPGEGRRGGSRAPLLRHREEAKHRHACGDVAARPAPPRAAGGRDRDLRVPGPGEVRGADGAGRGEPDRLEVRANGMNGTYDEVAPGQDGSGVIDAVGPDVAGFAEGDPVRLVLAQYGRWLGTAAEYTVQLVERVAPAGRGVVRPRRPLGVPAVTAHRALTAGEGRRPGLAGRDVGMAGPVAGERVRSATRPSSLARWAGRPC